MVVITKSEHVNFRNIEKCISAKYRKFLNNQGFPGSSAGKESACNADSLQTGDPGLIPGLGRSAGKGIGYPLQYSLAFLVAQTVKHLSAMQEIQV